MTLNFCFAGIIRAGTDDLAFYKQHMIAAAEFNDSDDTIFVNSMYSQNALHGLPISINLAMNAIVMDLFNESFSITISNSPLKSLYTEFSSSELSVIIVTCIWFILIPLSKQTRYCLFQRYVMLIFRYAFVYD
jgi:hypothetical protein